MKEAGDECKGWIIRGLEILLRNLGFILQATESHWTFLGGDSHDKIIFEKDHSNSSEEHSQDTDFLERLKKILFVHLDVQYLAPYGF